MDIFAQTDQVNKPVSYCLSKGLFIVYRSLIITIYHHLVSLYFILQVDISKL